MDASRIDSFAYCMAKTMAKTLGMWNAKPFYRGIRDDESVFVIKGLYL